MAIQGIDLLGVLLSQVNKILAIKFVIWGYTISFWNVLAFDIIVGAVGWFVWEVLLGDR